MIYFFRFLIFMDQLRGWGMFNSNFKVIVSCFFVFLILSIHGCTPFDKNEHGNPTGAIHQQGTDNSHAVGSAKVSFKLLAPPQKNKSEPDTTIYNGNLILGNIRNDRANLIPYAKAELLSGYLSRPDNQKIEQVKYASVVDSSITIAFNGVVSRRNVIVRLEFFGCSIYGVKKFEGEAFIHNAEGETVIFLHTAKGAAPNKTTDGRSLIEIGQPNSLGRVISGGLTFNDQGQPIGFSYEGYLTNFETGQNFFSRLGVGFNHFTYFNGYLYGAGGQNVLKISLTGEIVATYGNSLEPRNTVSGPLDSTIRFAAIDGICSWNDSLYVFNNWEQLVRIQNEYANVLFTIPSSYHRGGSILDNGDIWLYLSPFAVYEKQAFRVSNTGEVLEEVGFPNSDRPKSAIRYQAGVLFACNKGIFYWDGYKTTEWVSPYLIESNGYVVPGDFYIYKNYLGTIYVVSGYLNKIWRLE